MSTRSFCLPRRAALLATSLAALTCLGPLPAAAQAQVLNLLENLVKELGLTLAFISHDLSVIRRLCSRVLVLYRGEIVENAATAEVFNAPKAAYTRELLDAIPLPDPDEVWA